MSTSSREQREEVTCEEGKHHIAGQCAEHVDGAPRGRHTLASAGIMSPPFNSITSPGTSSRTGWVSHLPSLLTTAMGALSSYSPDQRLDISGSDQEFVALCRPQSQGIRRELRDNPLDNDDRVGLEEDAPAVPSRHYPRCGLRNIPPRR